jgi:hypothetical protein
VDGVVRSLEKLKARICELDVEGPVSRFLRLMNQKLPSCAALAQIN